MHESGGSSVLWLIISSLEMLSLLSPPYFLCLLPYPSPYSSPNKRIPFQRGVEIARQYGVHEMLRPLLDYAPQPGQELAAAPPRIKAIRRTSSKSKLDDDGSMEESPKGTSFHPTHHVSSSCLTMHPPTVPTPAAAVRRKSVVEEDGAYGFYSSVTSAASATVRPPPQQQPTNGERYRAIFMSVFLNHENHKLPDLLTGPNPPPADLDVDLIIDDQGHTSMHWAAALSRIHVLHTLLNLGADARRVNFNGESALVRAVLVTNNFDKDTFVDLLTLLHNAIDIVDKKGRTVIHHIALTAGIKGRMQASRYYLDSLLDTMSKTGLDIGAIIDVQDKNGDTALNIAARIGNRSLVEQLLRAGADPEIPNRAGLRPIDFGLEDARLSSLFNKVRLSFVGVFFHEGLIIILSAGCWNRGDIGFRGKQTRQPVRHPCLWPVAAIAIEWWRRQHFR